MAEPTALLPTLHSFHASSISAFDSLPDATSLLPPPSGVSLLDTKNDILLSYLQALALRNLNVIRSINHGASVEDAQSISDAITAQLVEHRVYLERGVKPLEQKMKYPMERAVSLAGEAERSAALREQQANGKEQSGKGDEESDGAGSSSDDSDDDVPNANANTHAHSITNANAFRPGTFAAPAQSASDARKPNSRDEGVYRPPRISATSMPTTDQRATPTRQQRSRTLDEYIATELSAAPAAEPSIGSTIAASGRRTKSAHDLSREKERTDYEETHLMRLPPESKKERARQTARERRAGFGGEEWLALGKLGESVDRVGELTRKRKVGVLERSRKRGRAVEDGPRGDGREAGAAMEMKRRRLEKKARR